MPMWPSTSDSMTTVAKKPTSITALIAANAVPLLGVLFLGWNMFTLMLIYWIESAVIGAFNVLKMATARGAMKTKAGDAVPAAAQHLTRLFMIPFFIVHYGGFMFGHLIFILVLFGGGFPGAMGAPRELISDIIWAVATALFALIISHGISFATNYIGSGEYKRASLDQLMAAPYKRIIVMHITIIASGFVFALLPFSVVPLMILIALKTLIDVKSHKKEHGII